MNLQALQLQLDLGVALGPLRTDEVERARRLPGALTGALTDDDGAQDLLAALASPRTRRCRPA